MPRTGEASVSLLNEHSHCLDTKEGGLFGDLYSHACRESLRLKEYVFFSAVSSHKTLVNTRKQYVSTTLCVVALICLEAAARDPKKG